LVAVAFACGESFAEFCRFQFGFPGPVNFFQHYIGIDYSGAGKPTEAQKGIRVYTVSSGGTPTAPPAPTRWSRVTLSDWLTERLGEPTPTIVGIDHAFSFPLPYLKSHHLDSWDAFLQHFQTRWPTRRLRVRRNVNWKEFKVKNPRDSLRVTEQFTSSAKSVFNPNGPGVAFSTFAGLPWLADLRKRFFGKVHFWPFDGWEVPAGRSVVAEVYPALFRNRYDRLEKSGDAHDAYAVCRWLCETDAAGVLPRYFQPPLSEGQKRLAQRREGWILGVV
jgi:hypothetical protein